MLEWKVSFIQPNPIHLKQETKITIKEFMNVDRLTAETIMSLSIVIVLCVLYTSIFLNYSSLDFTIILIHVLGNLIFSYKNLEFITISCFTCVLFGWFIQRSNAIRFCRLNFKLKFELKIIVFFIHLCGPDYLLLYVIKWSLGHSWCHMIYKWWLGHS